jgi:hypothetical protein
VCVLCVYVSVWTDPQQRRALLHVGVACVLSGTQGQLRHVSGESSAHCLRRGRRGCEPHMPGTRIAVSSVCFCGGKNVFSNRTNHRLWNDRRVFKAAVASVVSLWASAELRSLKVHLWRF